MIYLFTYTYFCWNTQNKFFSFCYIHALHLEHASWFEVSEEMLVISMYWFAVQLQTSTQRKQKPIIFLLKI